MTNAEQTDLTLAWRDNMLTIGGPHIAGGPVEIHYLEAFCRPGSTDREWSQTVIPHETCLVAADDDARRLQLTSTLQDGVTVAHTLTTVRDEVDFRLVAHNPTDRPSQAHWGQPCIRVGPFTAAAKLFGPAPDPYEYIRKCFIVLDAQICRMPFPRRRIDPEG